VSASSGRWPAPPPPNPPPADFGPGDDAITSTLLGPKPRSTSELPLPPPAPARNQTPLASPPDFSGLPRQPEDPGAPRTLAKLALQRMGSLVKREGVNKVVTPPPPPVDLDIGDDDESTYTELSPPKKS
jgi:hypothetical protein